MRAKDKVNDLLRNPTRPYDLTIQLQGIDQILIPTHSLIALSTRREDSSLSQPITILKSRSKLYYNQIITYQNLGTWIGAPNHILHGGNLDYILNHNHIK